MKLEVCANAFESAQNAQSAGANRIELCAELSLGGVTPSAGLIEQVVKQLSIETFVLIRPRSGDFQYSDFEFETMKRDILFCKSAGCSGVVSGILNSDRTIDIERTKELVECARPMAFTFHRAFDQVKEPFAAVDQLIELGIERILTSGHMTFAIEGMEMLKQLMIRTNDRLIIMPGGGINPKNAKEFKSAGFKEIHASASRILDSNIQASDFGSPHRTLSDFRIIRSILNQIQ